MPLLEVSDLSLSFSKYTRVLRRESVQVLNGVELYADAGEVVAVVGSSGSGKSLLAHAILGILPANARVSGTIRYRGEPLDKKRLERLRGKEIALVPQSVTYLDPLMRVGKQVRLSARGEDPVSAQRGAFRRYGLAPESERMYPFQLSGGMARRVLVSTATVSGARLIIADEPTPGMQPESVQVALRHFREQADAGCAVIVITHDIESVLAVADRIVVLYAGTTVEIAPAADFAASVPSGEDRDGDRGDGRDDARGADPFGERRSGGVRGEDRLRHPYSRALWRALPQNGLRPIDGTQPSPSALPPGCLFAPRCELASPECSAERPELRTVRSGKVRCIHAN